MLISRPLAPAASRDPLPRFRAGLCLLAITALLGMTTDLRAQDFGAWASTPPMGWNSWDCFGPTVTEEEVLANAAAMAHDLKPFGWQYVVVDIRWYVANDKAHGYNEKDPVISMDGFGRLTPAVNRFPSAAGGKGFKPLADSVHALGLKFGIHIMRGIPKLAVERNTPILGTARTARDVASTRELSSWLGDMRTVEASKPGAQEYYTSLFTLYASWGLDFVKVDDISSPYHADEIAMIRKAIDASGRPIVLSLSPGPTPLTAADHVGRHANMWRIIGDFWDNWAQLEEHFSLFEQWAPHLRPGHWPDGDMLPLGRIGIRAEQGDPRMTRFTRDEQTTLMSLFLICRSPLMFGGNLPDNDSFTLGLLTNPEALAVLQHGANSRLLFHQGGRVAWASDDAATGDRFVALFYSDPKVIAEHKAIWTSKQLSYRPGERQDAARVPLGGARKLYLVVTPGQDGNAWDHADWIAPMLVGARDTLRLTRIPWVSATAGWGTPTIGRSVGGGPLTVDGKVAADGIGTHAPSILEYDIPAGYDTFSATVGLDQECVAHAEGATVRFLVFTEYPAETPPHDAVEISVTPEQLGIPGPWTVRDLWGREDLEGGRNGITLPVRNHGARLLCIHQRP